MLYRFYRRHTYYTNTNSNFPYTYITYKTLNYTTTPLNLLQTQTT